MDVQNFIQQMIKLNEYMNTQNKLERAMYKAFKKDAIEEYFCGVNEECLHENYEHIEYFLGTMLTPCLEEDAEFRLVICKTCHKQVWLPKTADPNWNTKIGNRIINVSSNQNIKLYRKK